MKDNKNINNSKKDKYDDNKYEKNKNVNNNRSNFNIKLLIIVFLLFLISTFSSSITNFKLKVILIFP